MPYAVGHATATEAAEILVRHGITWWELECDSDGVVALRFDVPQSAGAPRRVAIRPDTEQLAAQLAHGGVTDPGKVRLEAWRSVLAALEAALVAVDHRLLPPAAVLGAEERWPMWRRIVGRLLGRDVAAVIVR